MSAWALCVASASAFVGPLHTRVRQPTCATSAVPATMRSIKIAKTNSWGDVESEVLGKLGLAAGADAEADDTDGHLEGVVDTLPVSPRVPRSGTQSWGRWSHEGESVELDLVLPEGSTAKELKCEVSRAGVLSIQRGDQTLLSGTLALPVDRTDLCWVVEEQEDGSKLLCVEVPMLPIDISRRATSVDCIFDESFKIHGVLCLEPGLSGVSGKA